VNPRAFIRRLAGVDTKDVMNTNSRHIRIRAVVAAVVAAATVGTGAAYAATRTTPKPIGTGVVVIETNLAYQGASAAGSGMVLTSSGRILTNNHVIAGATTIKVVIPGTSHTYTARVLGYDASRDVAVLQLQKASNLKTVTIGDASKLTIGSRVTAVGNAGGTGTLLSAKGSVTGLNRSITAQDESGNAEQLTGLIETDAELQPGDSGGPLMNSAGRVVGMDTAASTGFGYASYGESDGYAIPIGKALAIVKQIVAGTSSSTVHVGATAFLGVQVQSLGFGGEGAGIAGVVSGGPAASAGLQAGDVITAIDGQSVSSASDIQPIVLAHKPGDTVTVTYTDPTGASGTATVALGSGPPQ
jgi:S1-C subfamily serine protease